MFVNLLKSIGHTLSQSGLKDRPISKARLQTARQTFGLAGVPFGPSCLQLPLPFPKPYARLSPSPGHLVSVVYIYSYSAGFGNGHQFRESGATVCAN